MVAAAHSRKASIDALKTAMSLRKGGNGFDRVFLAMAHWRLGDRDEARKWYDRAVGWMARKKPKEEEIRRFRAEAAALLGVELKE